MAYNPQIQDISGQLLAQGMRARSQGIAAGATSGIQNFMKMEEERRKTTGAIQGMLADPYFQQQLANDPTMSAAASKIQSGKASLGDVQQFLGSMTSMQFGRQQQMKDQQMKMEQQRLEMERENAASTRAYQKGMTDAITRKEAEAKKQAEVMAKVFGQTVDEVEEVSPETRAYLEEMGLGADAATPTVRKRGLTAAEAMREVARMGGTINDQTVGFFSALGGEEANRAKERQRQLELEGKLGDTERKLQMRELEMELANRDPVISLLLRQRKMGEITEDEYRAAIKKQIEFLQTKDPSMFDRMMELSALSGGGGGGRGASTTRPGGTGRAPATSRY
jgi:Cu/Ag efflux pump CusA